MEMQKAVDQANLGFPRARGTSRTHRFARQRKYFARRCCSVGFFGYFLIQNSRV